MRKLLAMTLVCFLLAACAGAPPAWWNPGGVYSNQGIKTEKNSQQVAAPNAAPAQQPQEQTIVLQEDSYEEMTLTPLQDEEGENESGDSSAESVQPPEDSLPAPSILE